MAGLDGPGAGGGGCPLALLFMASSGPVAPQVPRGWECGLCADRSAGQGGGMLEKPAGGRCFPPPPIPCRQDWVAGASQGPVLAGPARGPAPPLWFCCLQQHKSTNISLLFPFSASDIFLITKVGLGYCTRTDVCTPGGPLGVEAWAFSLTPSPQLYPWLGGKGPSSTVGTSKSVSQRVPCFPRFRVTYSEKVPSLP